MDKGNSTLLPLGTRSKWGTIAAVGVISGERYYWLTNDALNVVSMVPACMLERALDTKETQR